MRWNEAGFTLIEVLVAISIMGMSLVIILSLFSQGLRTLQVDQAYTRAIILAKSKMGEVDLIKELEEGEEDGLYPGGFNWRREVVEVPVSRDEEALERRTRLYHIQVVVSWQNGQRRRQVALETLRNTIKPEWRRTRL
jgi:general secretion pathway protein I